MQKQLFLGLAMIVLIVIFVLGMFYAYEQQSVVRWNQWVATVQIVGQPGSTVRTVEEKLGPPDCVERPGNIGRGFLPKPTPPPSAMRVYVYQKVFTPMGGLWVAYLYVDGSGNIVGYHIAFS